MNNTKTSLLSQIGKMNEKKYIAEREREKVERKRERERERDREKERERERERERENSHHHFSICDFLRVRWKIRRTSTNTRTTSSPFSAESSSTIHTSSLRKSKV